MDDAQGHLWKSSSNAFVSIHQVFKIQTLGLFDQGIDDIHLPSFFYLLLYKPKDLEPVLVVAVDGLDGHSPCGKFVDNRYIQIPVEAHRQSSWNRSGGHDKHMGLVALVFGP